MLISAILNIFRKKPQIIICENRKSSTFQKNHCGKNWPFQNLIPEIFKKYPETVFVGMVNCQENVLIFIKLVHLNKWMRHVYIFFMSVKFSITNISSFCGGLCLWPHSGFWQIPSTAMHVSVSRRHSWIRRSQSPQ